jgi:hypothetical protein
VGVAARDPKTQAGRRKEGSADPLGASWVESKAALPDLAAILVAAGVAELVDARDLKSGEPSRSCGFDPHLRHQFAGRRLLCEPCAIFCADRRAGPLPCGAPDIVSWE